MAGFPTPPPLKQKPTVSAIPESVRTKIDRPERATRLLIAFGVVGLFLFLIPGVILLVLVWPWIRSIGSPLVPIALVLAALGWMGFSFGMNTGRRMIVDALRDQKNV